MKCWALACVFVVAFLSALAVTVPLSLAFPWLGAGKFGVSAADLSGTIWNGHLKNARYRDIPLGNVQMSLAPLSLFGGSRALDLNAPLGKLVLMQGKERGFETANIAIAIEHLGVGPPLTGNLRLENATVLFSDGGCVRADGRISAHILERTFGSPELSGSLSCVGEAAMVRLQGMAKDTEVSVTLRVDSRAHYEAQTHVASSDPIVRGALAIGGFVEQGHEFVRSDEGELGS